MNEFFLLIGFIWGKLKLYLIKDWDCYKDGLSFIIELFNDILLFSINFLRFDIFIYVYVFDLFNIALF